MKSACGICSIIPPYLLDRLATTHPDPKVQRACTQTLFATEQLRAQRSILSAGIGLALPVGELRRTIYDSRKTVTLPGARARSEEAGTTGDSAVNEAYDHSGTTYTFFKEVFGRKSIDNLGMRLDSSVHYQEEPDEGYDNAFWNGRQMVYGDGDGIVFAPFTKSLDVVAHELTHGITDYEAGLVYHNESGALNESFSDVFGIMVRQHANKETVAGSDWLIGKELLLEANLSLRSMMAPGTAFEKHPYLGTDRQPDHMTKYEALPDTRSGDWGGVHINSGIPNKAFYLACKSLGRAHSWEKAGRIWYDALCNRLGAMSQFKDAKDATVAAALALFDQAAANAVGDAWKAVGM